MGFFRQERILEWVVISSSRGSSQPRDWNGISCVSYIAGRSFTCWAIREAHSQEGLETVHRPLHDLQLDAGSICLSRNTQQVRPLSGLLAYSAESLSFHKGILMHELMPNCCCWGGNMSYYVFWYHFLFGNNLNISLLNCESFYYILNTSPLSDKHFGNIFS